MPKKVEKKLKKSAKKKGLTGKNADKYVYGTMEKMKKKKKSNENYDLE